MYKFCKIRSGKLTFKSLFPLKTPDIFFILSNFWSRTSNWTNTIFFLIYISIIARAILALLGLGWLAKKLIYDWLVEFMDNIIIITFLLYLLDNDGNWTMGCSMGDSSTQSTKSGSSLFSKNSLNTSTNSNSTASSSTKSTWSYLL